MKVSIIVPTYKEADNIPELFERLKRALDENKIDFEIIVVDDNSPDGTAQVAREKMIELGINGKVIVRENERGLSSAVVRGFKESSGDILVVMDADLQHPPEVIPQLVRAVVDGADIAVGSRYVKGGGVENWKWYRKLASIGATYVARVFLPQVRKIKDPVSGLFALKREVIQDVIDQLNPLGFKILMEILVKGKYSKVVEVPYVFQPRKAGSSKLSGKVIMEMIIHTLKLSWWSGELQRMIKFTLVGLTGIFVNLGALYYLVEKSKIFAEILGLGGRYVALNIAALMAFEASVLSNFILNDIWTFRDLRKNVSLKRRLVGFHIASYFGGVVQLGTYAVLVALGVYYLLANLIGIVLGYIVRFFVTRDVVYSH